MLTLNMRGINVLWSHRLRPGQPVRTESPRSTRPPGRAPGRRFDRRPRERSRRRRGRQACLQRDDSEIECVAVGERAAVDTRGLESGYCPVGVSSEVNGRFVRVQRVPRVERQHSRLTNNPSRSRRRSRTFPQTASGGRCCWYLSTLRPSIASPVNPIRIPRRLPHPRDSDTRFVPAVVVSCLSSFPATSGSHPASTRFLFDLRQRPAVISRGDTR